VDDDGDSVEVLSYLIRQEGGAVRGARSGTEALELLLLWTPDVMLFDISMPAMDGFELLDALRGLERLRDIPAVAVTAHAFERDKCQCIEAGFVEHVSKPYDASTLMQLIARLSPNRLAADG
jgi:CheY-like chemotaxis protein